LLAQLAGEVAAAEVEMPFSAKLLKDLSNFKTRELVIALTVGAFW